MRSDAQGLADGFPHRPVCVTARRSAADPRHLPRRVGPPAIAPRVTNIPGTRAAPRNKLDEVATSASESTLVVQSSALVATASGVGVRATPNADDDSCNAAHPAALVTGRRTATLGLIVTFA